MDVMLLAGSEFHRVVVLTVKASVLVVSKLWKQKVT